jgi:hypothetical protein
MGSGSLTTETDGDTASASDVNQYKSALLEDIVPRNSSGVATDQSGSLGTSALRWLNAYIAKWIIGTVASGLSIEEDSGKIAFFVGGSKVAEIDSNGLTFSSIPNGRAISSGNSGSFGTSSGTYVDITNLSVSITTKGNPVFFTLVPAETGAAGGQWSRLLYVTDAYIKLVRDSTDIDEIRFGTAGLSGHPDPQAETPPGSVVFYDTPSAGTYTYKLQGLSNDQLTLSRCRLLAIELI